MHGGLPYLVHHQLVLGETGDGCHQPAVSQHALAHIKPAGSSSEEVRALAEVLGGRRPGCVCGGGGSKLINIASVGLASALLDEYKPVWVLTINVK